MNKIYLKIGKIGDNFSNINLPQDVLKHIEKYKNQKALKQSYSAWGALEELINEKYSKSIKDCELNFSKRGKPLLKGLYISLSHTDEFYAVCVSQNRCGIDIEKMTEKDNMKEISKHVFNEEITDKKEFYKNWTKFESVSKLYDINLLDVKNMDLRKIYFHHDEFSDHYLTISSDENFQFERFN